MPTAMSDKGDSPFLPRSASISGTNPASQLARHGKYVLMGGLGSWWFGVTDLVRQALDLQAGFDGYARKGTAEHRGRKTMLISLGLQAMTISIFLYLVLFLPWLRGYMPNYPLWQRSKRLRLMVPILTFCILVGWITCVRALKIGSSAGSSKAMLSATSIHLLIFGLIGLIPSPKVPLPSIIPSLQKEQMDLEDVKTK